MRANKIGKIAKYFARTSRGDGGTSEDSIPLIGEWPGIYNYIAMGCVGQFYAHPQNPKNVKVLGAYMSGGGSASTIRASFFCVLIGSRNIGTAETFRVRKTNQKA